ncbi:hypothetical protein [Aquimarina sediminis]|uniref:hypothetical protein n=1 Tax=Aquimarina sediminis TaxID=2070536 RepID=UPI000CA0429B|nr:hypothetical protein [Aquimarina sediminis]
MRNVIKLLKTGSAIIAISLITACSSDDDTPIVNPGNTTVEEIKIDEGKLSAFPLFGINPTAIDIVDPEITDNKEVKYGEIKITVPATITLDAIRAAITSSELNLSKFEISPSNDVQLSYVDGKVNVYTIMNALGKKEELLHYNVSIIREVVPEPETLKITGFKFEKSKNPSLPSDIEMSRIIEDTGLDKLYIFVPVGTDFTDLIPTITYDGTKLYYYQDSSQTPGAGTEYPVEGQSIDFKYPKSFILEVKDRDNDQFRTTTVIVDVKNPLKVETVSVTTPDVTEGASQTFEVTKWTNQGNHMLVYGKADAEENQDPAPPVRAIRIRRELPSVGMIPGNSANVNVTVKGDTYPATTYKTTAVFYPRIRYHEEIDDLLEPAKLDITAKIVK